MRLFSVCLGVILSWHVLFVQHTYACDWRAELLDVTSKDINALQYRRQLPRADGEWKGMNAA